MQTCLRKAYYSLELGLRNEFESPALAFGTAIHKALEHWYSLPKADRAVSKGFKEEAELLAHGHNLDVPAKEGALESIRKFVNARYNILSGLNQQDKRSLEAGVRILEGYFKTYVDDGLEIFRDAAGPFIERDFEFVLFTSPTLEIRYFGTIDAVLVDALGNVFGADHKTSSSLGSDFLNRIRPNAQITGYVMGLQRAFGVNTTQFMINGLGTAKGKRDYLRQFTNRYPEDFEEFTGVVIEQVERYLAARAKADQGLHYELAYPLGPTGSCASYGGCQFLKIDELPRHMRANAIATLYPKT